MRPKKLKKKWRHNVLNSTVGNGVVGCDVGDPSSTVGLGVGSNVGSVVGCNVVGAEVGSQHPRQSHVSKQPLSPVQNVDVRWAEVVQWVSLSKL